MDSEVIVIEDSPPTSPEKGVGTVNIYKNKSNIDEYLKSTTQTYALPPMTDDINVMNTTENNNNKTDINNCIVNLTTEEDLFDPNLRNDLQDRGVIIRTQLQSSTSTSQEHSNLNSFNQIQGKPVYLPSYDNYLSKNNQDSTDRLTNVNLDENYHFLTERFMQPPSFYNINEINSKNYMPEFIDINAFMTYNHFGPPLMTTENLLEANKIYQTTECYSQSTKNNKKDKNSVPLFLKRNRNKESMKVVIDLCDDDSNDDNITVTDDATTKEPEKTSPSLACNDDDDDDNLEVVYVGAYVREPKYQTLPHTVYKLPADDEKENFQCETNHQSPISVPDSTSDNQNSGEGNDDDENKGRRRRKPVLTAPRRNPKRQVQIEKDYLKLLDNAISESVKDAKPKKTKKPDKSSADGKVILFYITFLYLLSMSHFDNDS